MADAMTSLSEPRVEQAGKKAVFTFASERVGGEFNGVVVQGFAAAEGLEGWIRFEEEAAWSDWQALYLVRSATDGGFMAAYRGDVFRRDQRFELRFDLDGANDLELVGAGVFDNRKDADRSAGALDAPTPEKGAQGDFLIVPSKLHPPASNPEEALTLYILPSGEPK